MMSNVQFLFEEELFYDNKALLENGNDRGVTFSSDFRRIIDNLADRDPYDVNYTPLKFNFSNVFVGLCPGGDPRFTSDHCALGNGEGFRKKWNSVQRPCTVFDHLSIVMPGGFGSHLSADQSFLRNCVHQK